MVAGSQPAAKEAHEKNGRSYSSPFILAILIYKMRGSKRAIVFDLASSMIKGDD